MHRNLLAAVALVITSGVGHAGVPNLAGTTWYTADYGCVFDGITFAADGTAALYIIVEDETDRATWSLDGAFLMMDYLDWKGSVVTGTVFPDHIDIVHTWSSRETQEIHTDKCTFTPGN